MNLPAPYNTLSFWKAVTFALAGLLALLGVLGAISQEFVYTAEALLAFVLTVFQFLNIEIENRARAVAAKLEKVEAMYREAAGLRNSLLDQQKSAKPGQASKRITK